MSDNIRVCDLRCREVINLADGLRLGYIGDVEIDSGEGRVTALVIEGKMRFFGLLGREEDYIIPWNSIERVGEDIILVRVEGAYRRKSHSAWQF
ncbi:MAG: YlmC/YmxH family sporulation protein [Clostridia bacterium]|nr:YlmC/YmxH family sporulation protein [Clostridia bacterium]